MKKQFFIVQVAFLFVLQIVFQVAVIRATFACSTCGCSEVCTLSMVQDSTKDSSTALTDSIWGNIILKMAYQRDAQIQKYTKGGKIIGATTGSAVAGAIGGTLAQTIISESTINPPPGQLDSYLPGSLGIGTSGLINVAFGSGLLLNWRLNKKIKARQMVLKEKVETILHHLEFSETACPQAQIELEEIIGERAAKDCIQLWRSSHATASASQERNISYAPMLLK